MLLWSLISVAWASPCGDVPTQVELAWGAYNEAELERAKALLAATYEMLGCQQTVVSPETLLEFYRLDALVSLTQEDRKGAVYATIRSVAVEHQGAHPPAEYGPELAELYETWASRLGETLVTVRVVDGGTAWIDGRPVTWQAPLQVVEGEHLVQIQAAGGFGSQVAEISSDLLLETGIPLPPEASAPVAPPPVLAKAPEPGLPHSVAPSVHDLDPDPVGRRRPVGLLVGGGVGAALGGAALGWAWQAERRFLDDPYAREVYGACERGTTCYAQARQAAIQGDATRIRIAYVGGYALTGVGLGVLGLGVIGLPVHTDGRTWSVGLRW